MLSVAGCCCDQSQWAQVLRRLRHVNRCRVVTGRRFCASPFPKRGGQGGMGSLLNCSAALCAAATTATSRGQRREVRATSGLMSRWVTQLPDGQHGANPPLWPLPAAVDRQAPPRQTHLVTAQWRCGSIEVRKSK